ncbi:GNAT family N-acetyltransferase [Phyllobacterium myrsinacearum]|uniref:GNAT family N-acetyltransferase n=1 Tax=Phyllobacterium myrsinacearum TaxID=28101 RepID=A0A2S9JJT4_9HYPH|nr:GNAT family protein [Phyllobacterium myrsinacearum]PRD53338.1 GNAT family N-acetyltransferase [Phyllobacterium myrsinacearum]PWV87673.1 RimJ/RimL family protein N-acetyltransferase [Phyllobacterium myrsinacearum]RZV07770.1 RimJ/RimL family protein N-acetyltransferase [Phyllobacterium myrsinacearum]
MVAELLEDDEDRLDLIDCPVLVTERLVLRAPHTEDVDAIARLADNPRVAEMLSRMPHPYTQDHAVDFVRRANAGEIGKCVYAITLAQSGTFIGCCGINYRRSQDVRMSEPRKDELEIGYWLGEPYWGKGYATETAHALVDLVFRATQVEKLHASCRVSNIGSRRVLYKSGFQYANTGMMDSLAAGNVPVERYMLDRRTWIGLRSWNA